MISTFTALFDANVLVGIRLKSLLLFQAQTGVFRARWSNDIHDEWIRAVQKVHPDVDPARLRRQREMMDRSVLDCVVTGYETLIPTLDLPDPDDRHVLAAAIVGKASVIVTFNESDFPPVSLAPYGIERMHPDCFLLDLDSVDPAEFMEAVGWDFSHYVKRPLTVDEYLADLTKAGIPRTAERIRARRVILDGLSENP